MDSLTPPPLDGNMPRSSLLVGAAAAASPRTYQDIQALSDEAGIPARNLLAMSVSNDPFYAGLPNREAWATWFAGLWGRIGLPPGVHLRRIHYRLVSDPSPPKMPEDKSKTSGRPYANTDECWHKLQMAARDARHLGLVEPDSFTDHRNGPPQINTSEAQSETDLGLKVADLPAWPAPRVVLSAGALGGPDKPEQPAVTVTGYDYEPGDQPYHLELWTEKTTMDDVLAPICRELGVNLVTSSGFQTVTGTVELLRRLERLPGDKPARIGYLSDFDPAGVRMPPAVARVVEFYLDEFAPGCDLKLTPVALTLEQVRKYGLPQIPIKPKDRRGPHFRRKYGVGATELDALEANVPGELAKIIRAFFAPYRDPTLEGRLQEAREEAEEQAQREWDEATADRRRGLEVLQAKIRRVVDAVRPEAQRLDARLQAALAPLLAKVERVRHAISEASVTGGDLPERPEPEAKGRDELSWLYSSDRPYLEQLRHYPEQNHPKGKYQKKARPTVKCKNCGGLFEQKRSDARCCSERCRTAYCRKKAKAAKNGGADLSR
jgi:hypothetical protein